MREDNARIGGVGARLAQAVAAAGVRTPVHALGLPGEFLPHGRPRADILRRPRLDTPGPTRTIATLTGGADRARHNTGDADRPAETVGTAARVPPPRGRQRAGRG